MPLTLAQLRAQVMTNLQPFSFEGIIDTVAIDRYLNDAQREIAIESSRISYDRAAQTAEDATFTLPSDCLILKAVAWENSNGYRTKPLKLTNTLTPPTDATGVPREYSQEDDSTFLLIPAPSEDGYVLTSYIARPTDLTESTSSALVDVDNMLISYATWMMLQDAVQYPQENDYMLLKSLSIAISIWQVRYDRALLNWRSLDYMRNPRRRFITEDTDFWGVDTHEGF